MTRYIMSLAVVALFVFGQIEAGTHRGAKYIPRPNLTGAEEPAGPVYRGVYPSGYGLGPGDSIGFTTYDYGTNGSATRNLINYNDGTFSLGRMGATVLDPGTSDRGTWYSFSDDGGGEIWPPLTKVEVVRTGWGSIDQFVDAGGVEVVVSHDFGAFTLVVSVDAAKGAGIWSSGTAGTAAWSRHAVGSAFTVHIVSSNGVNPPTDIFYHRSQDAGGTFDILDQSMFTASPGTAPDADGQDISAQGTTVAIVSAGTGADVGLMISTDNGDTWSEQVIYDVSGIGELPTGAEEPQPDGSCSVIFDNSGDVHVVWGNFLAVGNATNDPELFYSVDVPVMYWSEATGILQIAYPDPDTTIGLPIGRNGNYATQPDISTDSSGNLFVVYSAMVNDQDTSGNYYEHVFAVTSPDNGTTWNTPYDVTPGTGFEASFPSVADLVDDNMHIIYNCDPLAGNALQANHAQIEVAVMYLRSPAILTGVGSDNEALPSLYSLEQNYPNPFNPETEIRFSIPEQTDVRLKIYDLLGREVATLVDEQLPAGTYETRWDASEFASGVYLYRLETERVVTTKKLVILR